MQDTIEDVRTTVREARARYDAANIEFDAGDEADTREHAIRAQATVLNKSLEQLTREGDIAEAEAVGRAFAMMHRTHQQMFVAQVILPILMRLDTDATTGQFDARNEAACRFARKALEANEGNTYLPRI